MPEHTHGDSHHGPADSGPPAAGKPVLQRLTEAECLRLIERGGIGRIAYPGRFGLTVFPVNYKLHHGGIVFRTGEGSPTGEDLHTGIAHAEYTVAFEVDEFDKATHEGWSVLVQGPAHLVTTPAERAAMRESGVEPWPAGDRDQAVRITPLRVTGRRLSQTRGSGGR
ncbi:MAG TPA: pyridoxamine 5'-phosphate oxidase family protein [Streptosporangiaceae bacterium]|nr:pyridoxamine 5'-phosphate oxidase family protein [Streptosporangiaceae bacterium]